MFIVPLRFHGVEVPDFLPQMAQIIADETAEDLERMLRIWIGFG
jgi:hypothetical protein